MNLDFSADQKQLRDQARRLLADKCPPAAVRRVLDGDAPFDRALWDTLAEMGFTWARPSRKRMAGSGQAISSSASSPRSWAGRWLRCRSRHRSISRPSSSRLAGCEAQKRAWLPKLASGESIGTFAFAESAGGRYARSRLGSHRCAGRAHRREVAGSGRALADFAVVAAHGPDGAVGLFLVDLSGPGVSASRPTRSTPAASRRASGFDGAPAEPLGPAGEGWRMIEAVMDRAAVLIAFEQIGGADRALEMARDYALDRMAFGRQIGSFQAIKHMLADMYVSATLARSNAY